MEAIQDACYLSPERGVDSLIDQESRTKDAHYKAITEQDLTSGKITVAFGESIKKIASIFLLIIPTISALTPVSFVAVASATFFTNIVIFISGERTSFALLVLLNFYMFIMLPNLRKKIILFFSISLILIGLILFLDNDLRKRIIDKTYNEITNINIVSNTGYLDPNLRTFKFYIYSGAHNSYYLTAYNMFLDNILFGQGPRSYRYLCKEEKFKAAKETTKNIYLKDGYYNLSCSTHPHNYYFQLLAETGLVGFLFVIYILGVLILNILRECFTSKKRNFFKRVIYCTFFVNLWPLFPTGNFFNNWLIIIAIIPLSFLFLKKNDFI
jgi:O-antigen ligase